MNVRFLKTLTIKELYDRVPDNLEEYRTGNFEFLMTDSSVYFEGDKEMGCDKLAKISCDDSDHKEVRNCELMYSALDGLTPYLARDERLWVYLTHTILLAYTRKRWPIPGDEDKAVSQIRLHFFANGTRGIERNNAASRLWWMAHLCSRVDSLTLQESLETFLFQSDVRANIVERPTTSQSVHVFSAIIKKLYQSLMDDKKLFQRDVFRTFMKELNLQGGVRLLDVLGDDEVDKILASCI